jgi:hypothetical protein
MGEGPCGSSSHCLRVWSGLEHTETAKTGPGVQDVGTGKIQASGVQKEYEYDRRPNQTPWPSATL